MDIREFSADDAAAVADVVELCNAANKVSAPWEHPETASTFVGTMRHGWDGEQPRCYIAREDGRVVGAGELWLCEWDNRHLAWAWLVVHPDARRRGHGSELFKFLVGEARRSGRTSIGVDGWDGTGAEGFAARHGLERKSSAIQRRQYLDEVDRATIERLYVDASAVASSYELLRIFGRTPAELLDDLAEVVGSINDAPTDDLDIEDEVFTSERIANYENATLAKGQRLYRVVARHRDTGELAGHTVVAAESDRPSVAHQHDTSVVRTHRGHRLGVLLKADLLRWLAVAEAQLKTIDTWNAESNSHMIDVNERLGYRVLGREIQFQRDI